MCVCLHASLVCICVCVCGRVIEGTSGEVSLLLSLISPSCSPSSVLPLSLRVVCLVYNIFLSLRAESESQHLRLAVIYANSVSLVKTDSDWRIGASTNRWKCKASSQLLSSFSHFKTFILFLVLCFALIVLVGNLLTYVSNAGEWRITGVCRSLFKNIYIFQQGCSGWPALIFENCVIISSRKPRVLNWWLKQGSVMVVKQFIFWPLEMLDYF